MGQLAQGTFTEQISRTFLAKNIDELVEKLKKFEKNSTVRSLLESSLRAC